MTAPASATRWTNEALDRLRRVADPVTDPWIVVEDWWVDDGDQPGWAM